MDVGILHKKISRITKSSEKWKLKQQDIFLKRISELLQEGFSLSDGLRFLQVMMVKEKNDIQKIINEMEAGNSFPTSLHLLGFSEQLIVQLQFSMIHGNFIETLQFCSEHISIKQKQIKQFQKIAIYPMFLLGLATMMLFAIRQFLLPTIRNSSSTDSKTTIFLIFFLSYFPQILLIILSIILSIILLWRVKFKKKSAYDQAVSLKRIPLFGKWYKDYYTFFFSREFAYSLLSGQSIYQIIEMMEAEPTNSLIIEVATKLSKDLKSGENLPTIITSIPFFREEMTWIIYHGQLTSQLGIKLKIYSQECYRILLADIEKKINWLQPILFLIIGVIIISIYGVLMLPMLSMMRGV